MTQPVPKQVYRPAVTRAGWTNTDENVPLDGGAVSVRIADSVEATVEGGGAYSYAAGGRCGGVAS